MKLLVHHIGCVEKKISSSQLLGSYVRYPGEISTNIIVSQAPKETTISSSHHIRYSEKKLNSKLLVLVHFLMHHVFVKILCMTTHCVPIRLNITSFTTRGYVNLQDCVSKNHFFLKQIYIFI